MAARVVIVGGGFAGLNAARALGGRKDVEVTLIDRRNHHLFQPLLYQVATAGLSPADIAAPIRNILSRYQNVRVLLGEVQSVDFESKSLRTDIGPLDYDFLLLACGARHSYFGNDAWEQDAPGLKTIEHATEIRRRILTSYEIAERCEDTELQRKHLTFVVVGGGPTGVEMAGAIGEMSRYTLARDFRNINAKATRIFLMEGGPRILAAFPEELSDRAARDLENLGVQIWTSSFVTGVDDEGVTIGDERIQAATVIWAAGVQGSSLGKRINVPLDSSGRIKVEPDLSVAGCPDVFVAGDQAHFEDDSGQPLPGLAPVALQQGRHFARNVKLMLAGKESEPFKYRDKGIMATIGRNKAVMKSGNWQMGGWFAWMAWLVVHIYFLTGFRNRFFVVLSWAWSYLTYRRGARLIVGEEGELDEVHSANEQVDGRTPEQSLPDSANEDSSTAAIP
ncbi:MAG: NAD(P)/FAD-dependent oxidoreductase [Planctomycetota bacterium]